MRTFALAALVALASAPVALAEQPSESVAIELAAYDLNSQAGLAAL